MSEKIGKQNNTMCFFVDEEQDILKAKLGRLSWHLMDGKATKDF